MLRKLRPVTHFHTHRHGTECRVGVAVDVETTGLDSDTDKIIELAVQRFRYDGDGRIVEVGRPRVWREDPDRELDPRIIKLTGLTREMLEGKAIDEEIACEILATADLIVAHNAAFDRPFVDKRLPAVAGKAWACSMVEPDWLELGFDADHTEGAIPGFIDEPCVDVRELKPCTRQASPGARKCRAMNEQRPDPDAPLRAAMRAGKGRLKVFLGAAPGVGKTYEMLTDGAARREAGLDVVVGVVETHGQRETEAKVHGFEIIPRKPIEHRGQVLDEMDIDAILARKPGLVLVDELAHANAPGSRHDKRYQDVEELLSAGIDVYSTLNVQHLESLNDLVASFTKVRVRETLPDRVRAVARPRACRP